MMMYIGYIVFSFLEIFLNINLIYTLKSLSSYIPHFALFNKVITFLKSPSSPSEQHKQ